MDLRPIRQSSTAPILGLSLTIAALFQMLIYVVVLLYSLTVGGIDMVIPVKSAFIVVVGVLALKPLDDITVAWRNRWNDPTVFRGAIFYMSLVIFAAIVSISFALVFVSHPLSNIDLTKEDIGVRGFVLAGVIILLAFVLDEFNTLFRLAIQKIRASLTRRR